MTSPRGGGGPLPDVELTTATPRLTLRPIEVQDYALIRRAELDGSLTMRWRHRGHTPGAEDHVRMLSTGVDAKFLVCPRVEEGPARPAGLVVCYGADPAARFAYLAGTKFDLEDTSTTFVEGFALFVGYVFDAWPFAKLYMELPEWNEHVVASGIGRYFVEEARLGGHLHAKGRWWDQVTLALYRETWDEVAPAVRRAITAEPARPT